MLYMLMQEVDILKGMVESLMKGYKNFLISEGKKVFKHASPINLLRVWDNIYAFDQYLCFSSEEVRKFLHAPCSNAPPQHKFEPFIIGCQSQPLKFITEEPSKPSKPWGIKKKELSQLTKVKFFLKRKYKSLINHGAT